MISVSHMNEATARKAVKIVHSTKILADSTRREILRQLAIQPQTATQLAKKMNFTKSTIGHHLEVLRSSKLVKIAWAKPGSHGILEKYYKPIAVLFIQNYKRVPPQLENFFLSIHKERLRGMLTAFQLVGESWKQPLKVPRNFDLLGELAKQTAKHMPQVAKKYENTETEMDGETLLVKIYAETIKEIMSKGIWKEVFADISDISTLILKEHVRKT